MLPKDMRKEHNYTDILRSEKAIGKYEDKNKIYF